MGYSKVNDNVTGIADHLLSLDARVDKQEKLMENNSKSINSLLNKGTKITKITETITSLQTKIQELEKA